MNWRSCLPYGLVALFIGTALVAFRADLAKIEFGLLWTAREAIAVATLLSLVNYGLRMLRWITYLHHLGHRPPLGYASLSYLAGFAFTLSPGKVGELARGYYYRVAGVPLSTSTAAFFVERLLDLLAMLLLAMIGIAAIGDYDVIVWTMLAIVVPTIAFLSWRYPTGFPAGSWPVADSQHLPTPARLRWLPAVLRRRMVDVATTVSAARTLLTPGMLLAGCALGLVAWGAEGVGLQFIAHLSPGATLDLSSAIGVYSVAIIVGALSFLPGGLGTTEVVMAALLVARGIPVADSILIAVVCRLLTLWFAVAIGWAAVLVLRQHPLQRGLPSRALH